MKGPKGGGCYGGGDGCYGGGGWGGPGSDWMHQAPMDPWGCKGQDPWGFKGKGGDWGKGMEGYDQGFFNGGHYDGYGGPDFGKGHWGGDGDIMPGYGMMKGGDFGKGYNGMKGGDFGKGPYWGGEAKGNFPVKGCGGGKGFSKGKGKFGKPQGLSDMITEKIWVGGLPKDASSEHIGDFFSSFGPVQSVDLKLERDGTSRGFAFISFESVDAARVCVETRSIDFEGKWIDCKPASPEDKGKGKGTKGKDRIDENVPVSEKLFINSLPPETTEDALCFHFCQFGTVESVSLKMDPVSGAFRGFAFVVFESVEDAQLVLDSPDAAEFEGKQIDIKPAVEKEGKGGKDSGGKGKSKSPAQLTKIWVGCIPLAANENDVRTYFANYGDVVDVTLEYDEMDLFRGSAHVSFQSDEAAKTVLAHYSDNHFDPLEWEAGGVVLDIKPAESAKWVERSDVPITEKIFIGGLPRHVNKEQVSSFYAKYGPVREVLMKVESDGSSRGICFLTFRDVESARRALEDNSNSMGRPKPYAQSTPANRGGAPPTSNFLKVSGLPSDPKSRDVFRYFYNYSVVRIRDTGDDILIEFSTEAECTKAFQEKQGKKLGGHLADLSGGTKEEMVAAGEAMKKQDQNKGGKGGHGPASSGHSGKHGPY